MAVVAFPFTCFTSDDIDDIDSLQPYASSNDEAEKEGSPSLEPELNEDSTTALATADRCSEQEDDSTESVEADAQPSDDIIDDMIDEAMGEDDDVEEDNDKDETTEEMDMETSTTPASSTAKTYGGLTNLSNTCYMNAALQMLASLDGFAKELENSPAAESHKPELRRAFLDVISNLEKGETVSTSDFKKSLDERTTLFLGFHQEDSHEFLTTLLDLLDADYKATNNNDESIESQDESVDNEEKEETEKDETKETENLEDKEEAATMEEIAEEDLEPTCNDGEECMDLCQPVAKKPRSLDGTMMSDEEQEVVNTGSVTNAVGKSFSDLHSDGIEELLRWNTNNSSDESTAKPAQPKCKLAGGRMTSPEPCARTLICETEPTASTPSRDTQSRDQDDEASEAAMSPVDRYFQTEVRVRLTCESCKYTRTHRENFLHLSLEIGNDGSGVAGNVEDGLRNFFAPEKREIKCEKCFCASALQTMEITRLPVALLLHFKRFIVDISEDYSSITYRKNQSDVLFDDSLDLKGVLSEFVAEDFTLPEGFEGGSEESSHNAEHYYNIRSVVNHIGSSAACGHYTADSFRVYQGEERRWNRFNDSYVTSISPDAAMKESTRTAYMVMYELDTIPGVNSA